MKKNVSTSLNKQCLRTGKINRHTQAARERKKTENSAHKRCQCRLCFIASRSSFFQKYDIKREEEEEENAWRVQVARLFDHTARGRK